MKDLKIKHVRFCDVWSCIIKKRYKQVRVNNDEFQGYLSLTNIDEVDVPQIWNWHEDTITVCDSGMKWLVIVPEDGSYSIKTMMTNNKIVLWYIDMNDCVGIDEDGMYYVKDLFLDLIVNPTGEMIEDDRDELQQALEQAIITQEQYDKADETAKKLVSGMLSDIGSFKEFCMRRLCEIESYDR